jgi:branched-chain amino acid transport system substrate-binding protein
MRILRLTKTKIAAIVSLVAAMAYLALFALGIMPPYPTDAIYVAVIDEEGGETANGVRMLLDQVNQAGGINGKKVEMQVFDDGNEEDAAAAKALEIAEQGKALLVFGHGYSSTSIKGGEVYQRYGIPAISGSATARDVTLDNDWYFRVIFNNSRQAAIMANYIDDVLGEEGVTIIFDQRAYGKSLAEAFEQEAMSLGLDVRGKFGYDPREGDLDQALAAIVDQIAFMEAPGAVFLAVQGTEAVVLIRSIRDRGLEHLLVGADTIGAQTFVSELNAEPQTSGGPGGITGDYSEGIYAASPLIFDVANQSAQDFRREYTRIHGEEPGWIAASHYDAATIAVQAFQMAGVEGTPSSLQEDRRKIRDYLAGLDSPDRSFRGNTGPIYFDQHGDAIKSVPIGVFKNQRFISGPTQFQPVSGVTADRDFEQDLKDGRVIKIGGQYIEKAMVVYTGMEINKVRDINIRESSYFMDFNIWFRSNGEFQGEAIEFTNAASNLKLGEPISEEITEDTVYRAYRVKGVFKGEFALNNYPFDQHTLTVQFYNPGITREHLIFVRDELGMDPSADLLADLNQRRALDGPEWDFNQVDFFQDTVQIDTRLGHPDLLDSKMVAEFSRFNFTIQIEREIASYSVKNLTPLLLLVLLVYLIFFLPPDQIAVRITIGINVILATAFFSVRLSNELPNIGYLVAMEYFFIALYVLSLFAIFESIVSFVGEQKTGGGQQMWIRRLLLYGGKVGYPIFVLAGGLAMIWYYLL